MIAEYSSYLELLAAVYISMLLDIETLNKLWYPSGYYKKIQDALKTALPEEEGEGKLNNRIVDSSKTNAVTRNKRMRCRALFMLALTAILLALLGYEASFVGDTSLHEYWYNAVVFSYLSGTLLCFFGGALFDRWNTTSLAVLFVLIEFVALIIFPVNLPFYQTIEPYYPIMVVSLVTLPVLAELFSRWLFSSVYSGYLRNYVLKVKEDYDKALVALNSNRKKKMPRTYRKLINESIYTSNSDKTLTDICIQGYVDIRNKKLNEISRYPNGLVLFISWVGYTILRFYKHICFWKKNKQVETPIVVQGLYNSSVKVKDSQVVLLNYQREYDEFLLERAKQKGKLNIRQFCQQHGYDPNAMITWLKQRNTKK